MYIRFLLYKISLDIIVGSYSKNVSSSNKHMISIIIHLNNAIIFGSSREDIRDIAHSSGREK